MGGSEAHPSALGDKHGPLQAVDRKKITGVSVPRGIALFSAGSGLAEMGNTLGHCATPYGTGIALEASKLSKEYTRHMRKP